MKNLEALIEQYALNKNELDSYKKICDEENSEIKATMSALDLDKVTTDNYVAKLTIQHRETMDEDMLLKVLRDSGYADLVIRTKEYVDMDLLENAMYHEQIDADTIAKMGPCKQVKEVQTLKVTKRKKES